MTARQPADWGAKRARQALLERDDGSRTTAEFKESAVMAPVFGVALAISPSWTYDQTMKAINVSELKAHLSKYLRMASRGSQILVKDRDEPIAQLGPPQSGAATWRERMASEGRLRPGSQAWNALSVSKLDRTIDIQESLRAVREDPNEVRRH